MVATAGNAVGLRRAVLAILDNAIAHTPASGTVTVSVRRQGQLALAREVVTRHGGRLTVETTSERGSTFRVWLPRA